MTVSLFDREPFLRPDLRHATASRAAAVNDPEGTAERGAGTASLTAASTMLQSQKKGLLASPIIAERVALDL